MAQGVLARAAALLGATIVAAVATVAFFGGQWQSAPAGATPASGQARACSAKPTEGAGERAAEQVVRRFLRSAVVRSTCEAGVHAVPGLEHARYETRRPADVDGWWQLAPRIRNTRGLWEYAGFIYVDAPDAAPAAFEFLLELHGRRWLVSSFELAPGGTEVDFSKAPT